MREIKFRGRRLDNGEWVYGFLFMQDGKAYIITDLTPCGFIKHEVDPATVGQYTGLEDKDSKEIYEGDIMSIPETEFNAHIIGHVVYDEDAFFIQARNGGACWGLNWSLRKHNAQVIGNIHDNPELLKTE